MATLAISPVIIAVGLFALIALASVALAVFCFKMTRRKREYHIWGPKASSLKRFELLPPDAAIYLMAEKLKERLQEEALSHADASEPVEQGQQS